MSTHTSEDLIEQFRETGFAVVLLVGVLIFAFGIGFFILGVAIGTEPPAPYVSGTDKWMLIVGSAVAMVVGGVLIRIAAKIVGW